MDKQQFQLRFNELKNEAVRLLHLMTPYRTGDLRNSIRLINTEEGFTIRIGEGLDYLPYVNEPWTHPRWRGRKNPNEKFIEEAIDFILRYISYHMGFELRRI